MVWLLLPCSLRLQLFCDFVLLEPKKESIHRFLKKWFTSVLCPVSWIHVDVCGPCWCCHQRPGWFGSCAAANAMMVPTGCSAAEGRGDVHGKDNAEVRGTYWCRRPSGCPWSMLPLTVKSKVASLAGVLMTSDSQSRKRDIKGFCDNPYPTSSHPTLKNISA